MTNNNLICKPAYMNASGPLEIKLVNDYLFRELLQKNNHVLKALIAALLHMNKDSIKSVIITNPIMLSESFDEKDFVLDIAVDLNSNSKINLEMQVINQGNWVERSISYLGRLSSHIEKGKDYCTLQPAIQIGLLDYTLFPDFPEFYANYYLINEKTQHRYSDKFRLSVLNLTRIDLATDEDKKYRIDHWARLFKATTWEELKMLAQVDSAMDEAVSTIYDITQDSEAVWRLRARDEHLAHEKYIAERQVFLESRLRKAILHELKEHSLEEVAVLFDMPLEEIQALIESNK